MMVTTISLMSVVTITRQTLTVSRMMEDQYRASGCPSSTTTVISSATHRLALCSGLTAAASSCATLTPAAFFWLDRCPDTLLLLCLLISRLGDRKDGVSLLPTCNEPADTTYHPAAAKGHADQQYHDGMCIGEIGTALLLMELGICHLHPGEKGVGTLLRLQNPGLRVQYSRPQNFFVVLKLCDERWVGPFVMLVEAGQCCWGQREGGIIKGVLRAPIQ